MNYCSIQDAWGNCNRYSKQYKKYMNDTEENEDSPAPKCYKKGGCPIKNIEQFGDTDTEKKENHSINYDEHMDELSDCDKFLVHIKNCRQCNQKARNYFKPQFNSHILENFQNLIETNKDTLVLILIGISILLIFNMIQNLTK